MKLYHLVLCALWTCLPTLKCLYKQRDAGLSEIPHSSISSTETIIDLQINHITSLKAFEFLAYPNLLKLDLSWNDIDWISADAFNGTQLEELNLAENELKAFPDLTSIAESLEDLTLENNKINQIDPELFSALTKLRLLDIKGNSLTTVPDFSLVSTEAAAGWRRININVDYKISTLCHFKQIVFSGNSLEIVPQVNCSASESLWMYMIFGANFNDLTDFINLTYTKSMRRLDLGNCQFVTFPDLPFSLRKQLSDLNLPNNQISVITSDRLEGYQLTNLDLERNRLVTVPFEIFFITKYLGLEQMMSLSMDVYFWNEVLGAENSTGLEILYLAGSVASVAELPVLTDTLCQRLQQLTIELQKVSLFKQYFFVQSDACIKQVQYHNRLPSVGVSCWMSQRYFQNSSRGVHSRWTICSLLRFSNKCLIFTKGAKYVNGLLPGKGSISE